MKKYLQSFLTGVIVAFGALPLFAQVHIAPLSGNPHGVKGIFAPSKTTMQAVSAPTATLYSHGNPTAEEQYILELVNRARANPAEEGLRLAGGLT